MKTFPFVVDFHTHTLNETVLDRAEQHSVATGFGKRPLPRGLDMMKKMFDPRRQIEDMDQRGIDVHVISSATIIEGLWWASGKEAAELNRRLNDQMAAWVGQFPKRFVGSFTLPLQEAEGALTELHRAVNQLGLKVANLPASVDGTYLGDPKFHPLWAEIAAFGLAAFIHPDGVKDPWFQNYALWNSLGQSIEETKVMSSLIYEGVLEKFPALKIVMAHGGGYMPHYMGRLDRNVTNMPQSTKNISKKPSAYLSQFYYDSCVYDVRTLEVLIERVGADRIVLGGDYPVADVHPVEFVQCARNVSGAELAMIVGGTAARLLA